MKMRTSNKGSIVKNALLPQVLNEFLHENFRNKKQKEIAFIILKNLYGDPSKSYPLPLQYYLQLGYSRDDFRDAKAILLDSELVVQTRKHSYTDRLAGEYQYNFLKLLSLLRRNEGVGKGLQGKPPKRTIETQTEGLKDALKRISLPWCQSASIDYLKTLSPSDQYRAFNTIHYMSDGDLRLNWREQNCFLYAHEPALTFWGGFWQKNIVGGGESLYCLDYKACYPNLTKILATGTPCTPEVYERFMMKLPDKYSSISRSEAKELFNRFCNGGTKQYERRETLDAIKAAILETLEIEDFDFRALKKIRPEVERQCGTIISLALMMAVQVGFTRILPLTDCFYTTHEPDKIMKIMYEASLKVTGHELDVNYKEMPQFSSINPEEKVEVGYQDENTAFQENHETLI